VFQLGQREQVVFSLQQAVFAQLLPLIKASDHSACG
jgi:hypothetical protein